MLMQNPFPQEFMQNPFYDLGSTSSSMPFASSLNSDVLRRDYATNPINLIISFPTNTSRIVTSTRIQDHETHHETYHETQNVIMPFRKRLSEAIAQLERAQIQVELGRNQIEIGPNQLEPNILIIILKIKEIIFLA